MNKERQRKLEARARRQESLVNAHSAIAQVSEPEVTKESQAITATESNVIKNKVAVIEKENRGNKNPPKSNKHLKVKQTSKGKEKSK